MDVAAAAIGIGARRMENRRLGSATDGKQALQVAGDGLLAVAPDLLEVRQGVLQSRVGVGHCRPEASMTSTPCSRSRVSTALE